MKLIFARYGRQWHKPAVLLRLLAPSAAAARTAETIGRYPVPTEAVPQHLCLDKSYDNAPTEVVLTERGYVAHIRCIGKENKDETGQKTHPARRWVVERTFSWLSRWRGLLIRWDKKPENYLANLKLACALLWFRRAYQEGSRLLG